MEVISDQTLGQDCREEVTPSELLCSFSGLSCVQSFATPWTVARQMLLWDFAGKNTGVDCRFLLQGIFPTQGSNPCFLHWQVDSLPLSHLGSPAVIMKVKVNSSVMPDSLRSHGLLPTRFLCPWNSPGKNPGVGCPVLLQGIFPNQGLNPGLLHYRQILTG